MLLHPPARPRSSRSTSRARAYFSPAQSTRAERLPRPASCGSTGPVWRSSSALLVCVVAAAAARRRSRRPVLAGARSRRRRLSVALTVATLPVAAISRERAKDVGLVTQELGRLGRRRRQEHGDRAVLAGAGGALARVRHAALRARAGGCPATCRRGRVRRGQHRTPARSCSTRCSTTSRRSEGQLRAEVLELAREAGVDVGQVYEVDASRRTTAANAYVDRARADQAGGDLRHAAQGLHAATSRGCRGPRARPRALPRRAARPALPAIVAPFGMLAVARLAERHGAARRRARRCRPSRSRSCSIATPIT